MSVLTFHGEDEYLSNFYAARTRGFGDVWPTVEHGFQAAKFMPMAGYAGVPEAVTAIAAAATPGQAKRLGRSFASINPAWERLKDDVMLVFVLRKFEDDPELRARLRATGSDRLVEGNGWGDTYWGAEWQSESVDGRYVMPVWASDEHRVLVGRNQLGRTLMVVREALRE